MAEKHTGVARCGEAAGPFQILALSGGGYLGLYSASILAELEDSLGRPIRSCFDMVTGTSVGGIIALGVAAGIPARQIADALDRSGVAIFSNRLAPKSPAAMLRDMRRMIWKPKYSGHALRETVRDLVGDRLVGDLDTPCLVPAVNLTKGGPQLFKTPHHPDFKRDWKLKVADVAMATSAAPTFFPLACIGDELFADGGLFANSPDLLGLHEAEHFLGVRCEQVRILSIGTTTSKFSFSHSAGLNLGIVGWTRGQRLVQAMIASQQQVTDSMLKHRLGASYLRLDALQSPEQVRDLALDVAHADARRTIRGMAAGTVQDFINHPVLNAMLKNHAPSAKFFYGRHVGEA